MGEVLMWLIHSTHLQGISTTTKSTKYLYTLVFLLERMETYTLTALIQLYTFTTAVGLHSVVARLLQKITTGIQLILIGIQQRLTGMQPKGVNYA